MIFLALASACAYTGYRDRIAVTPVASERWMGLFWLSLIALVFWSLLQTPRIANIRVFGRKHN